MTSMEPALNTEALEDSIITVDVMEKADLSADIVSLTLRPSGGGELPEWEPGAHVDLLLANGQARQYSLCGDPRDRTSWRIAVLRDPASRGGSAYVHDSLHKGHRLQIRGPRNHFPLVAAPRYVFVAGGIGVTPLIPMAQAAADAGADWTLIYCARSRAAMGFLSELEDRFGDHLVVNADDESGLFDLPGYFSDVQADTSVYACGPAPFLDATEAATAAWPTGAVRFERFTGLDIDEDSNVPFEVELSRSGRVLEVAKDRSVLETVKEAGVMILSSCTEGTCGTCETAVISGEIDHRDTVLSDEERESGEMMMVCVSRSCGGRLVLDL